MIYAIVGTDTSKREKAYESLTKEGTVSVHVYSEQIASLEALIEASSLFGEKVVVNLIQAMEVASSRDEVIRLFPDMKESSNIFIIDEPFADANRVSRLTKYAEKVFDAREEKKKEEFPSAFLFAFEKRDKKSAWVEWTKIRGMDAEKLQGAIWWKFQSVWQNVRSGRSEKFTLQECEDFGGRIVRSSIEAHRGEKELGVALEEIILGL